MIISGWAYAFISLALLCGGQLTLRYVAPKLSLETFTLSAPGAMQHLLFLALGMGIYAVSSVTWIMALRTLPLTRAYAVIALAFGIVPVLAHFILDDPLQQNMLLGFLIIMVGVVITVIG